MSYREYKAWAGVKQLVSLSFHKRPIHAVQRTTLIGFAAACLISATALGFGGPAAAASGLALQADVQSNGLQHNPFSTLVGERRKRRDPQQANGPVERYVLASDERTFLFEDRGATARIQFLCGEGDDRFDCVIDPDIGASEIYLLEATRAPRGDVVYRNANGEALLRIASYGGATVFWPGDPQGRAASKSFGDNPVLELLYTDHETAQRRAQSATAMLSARTGAPIIFDLGAQPSEEGASATVLADAVVTAAKGLSIVSRDPTGARVIGSRIERVVFTPGASSSVALRGKTLDIGYMPNAGIEGRPSSTGVARYLEENL